MDPEIFSKLEHVIKLIRDRPDSPDMGEGWNQAQRDFDVYNFLMNAIREHIPGRFDLFSTYPLQDYEAAMQDLNELLELIGK